MIISKTAHISFGPEYYMFEYVTIEFEEFVNNTPVFIPEPISERLELAYRTVTRRLGLKWES
jgi:hypothetical protein